MKISMLHYGNSIIDFNRLFGMQVMEVKTLNHLLERKDIEASLFAKQLIGEHKNIFELQYDEFDNVFNDVLFYSKFFERNRNADVLQGNSTPLLSIFKPEKTIIRINGHFEFPYHEKSTIRDAYHKANYLFISEYIKKVYLDKYPFFDEEKCFVLHNAVDYAPPPPLKNNKKVKILFCSRWIAQKGFHLLLHVIRLLEKKRNDVEIILAGGFHAKAGVNELETNFTRKLNQKLKNNQIVRVVGYLKHDKLLELFNEVDIHLFPSLWGEPFGLVSAEAAMAQVPTIAFNNGALPEVVRHNETGILVERSRFNYINVKRLLGAIELLVDDPGLRTRMGKAARDDVLNRFAWDKHIDDLVSIYNKIIAN